MSEDKIQKKKKKKKKNPSKFSFGKFLKLLVLTTLIILVIGAGVVGGMVASILKDVPKIDPTNIYASLDQTSFIYGPDGELIEKIQAPEFRTIVELNQMPVHLRDAFIAIEDERFEKHIGVDPKGIASSAIANIKAGTIVRGASTITQQLVKNVYLSDVKSWDRKIKEAYLALQVEKILTKDQILELYLNRIFLGQNAYGVQEAAQTYFSKNVGDLTVAESALLAGIVKSTSRYAPYEVLRPEDFNPEKHKEVGHLEILDEKYIAVYNPTSVERQRIVLKQMLNLNKITKSQYDQAISEDISANLKPAERKIEGISSYFSDLVKSQVIEALMNEKGYTKEQAQNELFSGGLKIYSTIDLKLQKDLEEVYDNFTNILVSDVARAKAPVLINWRLSKSGNVIDENNNVIYFSKDNLFNENFELIIENGSFEIKDGSLFIKNNKLTPYKKHIDVGDYYIIDERKNLVTYTVGSITPPEDKFSIGDDRTIQISSSYISENPDFYRLDENGNMLISDKYFYRSRSGISQPQSATVFLDYRTGQIKALVGGRDVQGSSILNRATSSQRQPGSVMKPIAAYWPALDMNYTAASPIDDVPYYVNGELWPKNWYRDGYRGIYTIRRAVEQSANVPSVKMVESIGIGNSMEYLKKMGIISTTKPESDSFITAAESPAANDENLSSLGLGGMTKGLTPLEVTAAFGAIANNGVYIEPRSFTKVEDKHGNILIDNQPKETQVTSPQAAYIMADILRTTVSDGIAGRAKIPNMATAGKTGTTQNQADIWFVGFTPYYATGVWIGNDSPKITISQGSGTAASFWKYIMTKAHDGLEAKNSFDKPEGIVTTSVCTQSGLLPTALCSSDPRGTVRSEIFVKGTEPKSQCDIHVEAQVDEATGKLAGEFCPESSVVTKVFIKRNPPYNPSENGGIVPTDYIYSLPFEYCDLHDENTVIEEENTEEDDELESIFETEEDDDEEEATIDGDEE